ncbi:MAG TPA: pyruvate, phosphate dikinase [Acidimicrobiales bacterium]|nr:pyruvate, phosphate dikinase [Acidimicrobiales bacterium]
MPYVFDFDHPHDVAPRRLRALLGGKGANLAEMTSVLGLPVPPGFTISTEACREYLGRGWPEVLDEEIAEHLGNLERSFGRRLGDGEDPLLVSVRSGAQFSMPGMMDTVLDLGLNDRSVAGLASQTADERFAYDSYRRFVAMYARIVLGLDAAPFDAAFEDEKVAAGVESDAALPTDALRRVVATSKALVERATGAAFPEEPAAQLRGAIAAVFSSWLGPRARAYREREHIAHDLGTAVTVQAMVFGNRDDDSGTGVAFTRDPATGERRPYGDFLVNAQGEDVVAGIRNTLPLAALAERFPDVHGQLVEIFERLEAHFRDMCDIEFTIEQGRLWMLQTRVGKRTGRAALRMAVDMVDEPVIALSHAEAVARVRPEQIDGVLHPQFAGGEVVVATRGLGASPGAAVGRVVLSADAAVEAAARGESVVLVTNETSPEDVRGMLAATGILTRRGGLVSHAAVVARGWGKPAVVGAERVEISGDELRIAGQVVRAGDMISIDGSSGVVVVGAVELASAEPPETLETVLAWADEIRAGRLGVRANADNGPDAANARRLGAEGIGLCRTEHMFLAEDRLPIVRQMILATDPAEEAAALAALREVQREDFAHILEAMDGLPVTVRLLDPPLHEFLPDVSALALKAAMEGLSPIEERLYEAARSWHELNPMLGTRGVRLGIVKPGLYAMQVSALVDAAVERLALGGRPVIEVMIPLTVSREELALARSWVEDAIAESRAAARGLDIRIGTMVETPRAALRAGELAQAADFFSFGTNDLTQMTFGFSRDDVEARMMAIYLERGLIPANPFERIDAEGVGELVRTAALRGREANPSIKLGICGEHGGDPESIAFFAEIGLDYVSCSPFRIPIARLAAAQALLALDARGIARDVAAADATA